MGTGSLHGVFTNAYKAGPRICFRPDWPSAGGAGAVEVGNYYAKGEIEYISATEQVLLVPDFHADKGSTITVEIKP